MPFPRLVLLRWNPATSFLHSVSDLRNWCEGHIRFDFVDPADEADPEPDEPPGPRPPVRPPWPLAEPLEIRDDDLVLVCRVGTEVDGIVAIGCPSGPKEDARRRKRRKDSMPAMAWFSNAFIHDPGLDGRLLAADLERAVPGVGWSAAAPEAQPLADDQVRAFVPFLLGQVRADEPAPDEPLDRAETVGVWLEAWFLPDAFRARLAGVFDRDFFEGRPLPTEQPDLPAWSRLEFPLENVCGDKTLRLVVDPPSGGSIWFLLDDLWRMGNGGHLHWATAAAAMRRVVRDAENGIATDEDALRPGTEDDDRTAPGTGEWDPKFERATALLEPAAVGPALAVELDGILTVRPRAPGLNGLEEVRWSPDEPADGVPHRIPPLTDKRSWTNLMCLPKERAREKLLAAAKRGAPKAVLQLGEAFERGWPVERDPEQAVLHVSQAAEKGWIPAVEKRAMFDLVGFGGPPDPAKAVEGFRAAASADRPLSILALADCLWEGRGVPEDRTEAARLYCLATNHPRGRFNALVCLARGLFAGDVPGGPLNCLRPNPDKYGSRSPTLDFLEGIFHEFGISIYRSDKDAYGCYRLAELGGCAPAKARADAVRERLLAAGETPPEPDPDALAPPFLD